jgi:hypothetical protein
MVHTAREAALVRSNHQMLMYSPREKKAAAKIIRIATHAFRFEFMTFILASQINHTCKFPIPSLPSVPAEKRAFCVCPYYRIKDP